MKEVIVRRLNSPWAAVTLAIVALAFGYTVTLQDSAAFAKGQVCADQETSATN